MLPYFLVAIIVPTLVYASQLVFREHQPLRLRWILMSPLEVGALTTLVLFAGTRAGVGTDYEMYASGFERLDPAQWGGSMAASQWEPGFTAMVLLVKTVFGTGVRAPFLMLSAVTVILAYVAIRLVSPQPAIAVAIYILYAHYLSSFNSVRQGLAMAMLLFASALLERTGRRSAAAISAVAAGAVHVSAWAIAPVVVLLRRVRVTLVAMVALAALAILGATVLWTMPAVREVMDLLNVRYATYVESGRGGGLGTILVATTHLVIAALFFAAGELTLSERWWRSLYALTGPLALLGVSAVWAARVSEYFSLFLVLLAPSVLQRLSHRVLWTWLLLGFGVAYFFSHLSNFGDMLPYASWLSLAS